MKKFFHLSLALIMTAFLALALSRLGTIWIGQESADGQMTIMARITKNVVKTCRPYTEDELKTIPLHMRRDQLCDQTAFPYNLIVSFDGKKAYEETVVPQSLRGDHPMNLQKKIPLKPGSYFMHISLTPSDAWKHFVEENQKKGLNSDVSHELATVTLEQEISVEAGRIIFVALDEDAEKFVVSEK